MWWKKLHKLLKQKTESGELKLAAGVSYKFAGNYEQQIRATKRLARCNPYKSSADIAPVVFPVSNSNRLIYSFLWSICGLCRWFYHAVAIWTGLVYEFFIAEINLRDMFQMHTINLSVAVWVGFIALFGIATNDGVIMGTYIHQVFEERHPATVHEVTRGSSFCRHETCPPCHDDYSCCGYCTSSGTYIFR